MVEKRQPPLWLDMDFAEALARFGQTDWVEVKDAEALALAKKAAGAPTPRPMSLLLNLRSGVVPANGLLRSGDRDLAGASNAAA